MCSIPIRGTELSYIILIFLDPRSSNEIRRGFELRHSKRDASRIRRKVSNGSVLTLSSQVPHAFPAIYGIKDRLLPCFYSFTLQKMCIRTNGCSNNKNCYIFSFIAISTSRLLKIFMTVFFFPMKALFNIVIAIPIILVLIKCIIYTKKVPHCRTNKK